MNRIKSLLRGNIRQYAMIIALVVVVVVFEFLTKGILLKPLNISNLIQQNAYVLILAIGMLLCILTIGNIDLSVGSVVGLVGALSAIFILKMDMPIWSRSSFRSWRASSSVLGKGCGSRISGFPRLS